MIGHERKRLQRSVKITAAGLLVERGPEYLTDIAETLYGVIGDYQVMVIPDKTVKKRREINTGSRKKD
jgi:hypothetical protein